METAERHGSVVILANDPDADRLAVAERRQDGSWRVFNGNEFGVLLGWWALEVKKRQLRAEGKEFVRECSGYMCGLVPEYVTPKEEHYGQLSTGIYVVLLVLVFVPCVSTSSC